MKIIDEFNYLLFVLDRNKIPNIANETELTEYLKKIFNSLKTRYNFEIYGYYNVKIYLDNYFGMIIKLNKENSEYLTYYSKQIEMKITIADNDLLLYRINDFYGIDQRILQKSNIYLYDKKLYLELTEEKKSIMLGHLLELSELIFENTDKIKKNGQKIEIG